MTGEPIVETVTGPIPVAELGPTLTHEHLAIDLSFLWERASPLATRRPLETAMLGSVRRDPLAFEANLVVDAPELVAGELRELRALGGRTVVELTPAGIGRDPVLLRDLAEATGVRIVAGCGFYTERAHPAALRGWSVERCAEEMITDLCAGIGDTGVRAGVIGEIGTSDPVSPQEWRVVEAAARAQRETGRALFVHVTPGGGTSVEVARFLLDHGADPRRVVICHVPGHRDVAEHVAIARLGVNLGYDNFGLDAYFDSAGPDAWALDAVRERCLLELLHRGYASQVLLSHDLCMKFQLQAYGGHGLAHLLRTVLPRLAKRGVDQATLDQLMVGNPAAVLGSGDTRRA